jgi:predicted amidohydrolase
MQHDLTVAAIQLNACHNRRENLARAVRAVETAAQQGAKLIVLPELFNGYGDLAQVVREAETIPGPTSETLQALSARLGIWLLAGSIGERSEFPDRGYNTSLLFDPQGNTRAKYRKIHLFDVDIPGKVRSCESEHMLAGEEPVCLATDLGTLGIAICYDLRFPELFRRLSQKGLELLLFPAAFTRPTGKHHWEVLLRARAIENQCYIIAANQCGEHTSSLASYGHSMIVDPWGRILAAAGEEETIISTTLSAHTLHELRECLPVLKNRRLN